MVEFTPADLLTLRIVLEHIFREHDNCRTFLEMMGPEKYDMTRDLWYKIFTPMGRS